MSGKEEGLGLSMDRVSAKTAPEFKPKATSFINSPGLTTHHPILSCCGQLSSLGSLGCTATQELPLSSFPAPSDPALRGQ